MSTCGSNKWKKSRSLGFVCVFCDKYFTGTCIESIHILRHIREKPYNCQFCDYSAVCASDVGQHERRLHKSRAVYKCSKCTRTFKVLVYLENHLRTHDEFQMACQESEDVKVEVKEEEDMNMEATTSTPSHPPAKRTREQKERNNLRERERYRKRKLEEQKRKEEGLDAPPHPLTEEELEEQEERRRKHAEQERKRIARIRQEDPQRFEEIKKRKREKAREYSAAGRRQRKKKEEPLPLTEEDGPPLTEEELEEQERRRRLRNEQQRRNKERRKKEDPERFEEMKKRSRFQSFVKKAAMTLTMTEEEIKQHKLSQYLRNHAYYKKGGRWSERSEEWKEKQREANKRWLQKHQLRGIYDKMKVEDPAKWESFYEKQKAYQRERYANETPEKRERRRRKEKVNAARRRLKKQLEKEGVGEEEIQRRDEELKVRMWKEFDPKGEVPGSTTKYRRKKKMPSKMLLDFSFTPSQTQAENEEWFGGEVYIASSPPPSPCSTPMPPSPSPDDSTFPDPDTQFLPEVEACSRDFPSTEEFQCSHCSSTFQDENERRIHIQLMLPSSCWKCPKCDEVVLSSADLSQHYNSAHKRIQSDAIEDVEKKNTEKKEESSFKFQCMRCPHSPPKARKNENSKEKFKTRLELLSHVQKSHPGSYWPCKDCHLLKYSEQSLQIHLNYCRLHRAKRRRES